MAKHCDVCGQSYAVHFARCPFCDLPDEASARHGAARDHTPLPAPLFQAVPAPVPSDAEVDLDRPVGASCEGAGPPSGASFTSWADHIPSRGGNGEPAGDARPEGRLLRDPASNPKGAPPPGAPEAEVALDRPVGTDDGPPSGASFVAWSALLPRDKTPAAPAPAPAPAPPPPPRSRWLAGVVAGLVVSVIVCVFLWLVGLVGPPRNGRGVSPADTAPGRTP